jgi:hypothetical protein
MSKSVILEKIKGLVQKNQGFNFSYWVSKEALSEIVSVYKSVLGSDCVLNENNAKNLAWAFMAFVYYNEDLLVSDYNVFLTNIIDKQFT